MNANGPTVLLTEEQLVRLSEIIRELKYLMHIRAQSRRKTLQDENASDFCGEDGNWVCQ